MNIDTDLLGEVIDICIKYPGICEVEGYIDHAIVVISNYDGPILSKKLLSFGITVNGLLYFTEDSNRIRAAQYELMVYQKSIETNPDEQKRLEKEIEEIKRCGHIDLPAYFG